MPAVFPAPQTATGPAHVSPCYHAVLYRTNVGVFLYSCIGPSKFVTRYGRRLFKVLAVMVFTFNEGHAKSLVRLGVVDRWRLRPIVIFVGDSEMKTADKFRPFDENEKIARQKRTWRMKGVVCMSLAELHRHIDFSINALVPATSREHGQIRQGIQVYQYVPSPPEGEGQGEGGHNGASRAPRTKPAANRQITLIQTETAVLNHR